MQNFRHSCSGCSFAVCSTMGGHIKHFQGHWDKMPRGVRSQWLSCIEWDFSEESESLGITRTQHTQTHHSVNTSCAHSKGDPTQLSLCSGTRGTVITFSWILVIFLQESMELVADFKHAWPLLTLIFIFLSSFRSSCTSGGPRKQFFRSWPPATANRNLTCMCTAVRPACWTRENDQ